MLKAKLTSKGQVTIPKAVRERLGLVTGDQLRFHVQDDGTLALMPPRRDPLGRLPGLLQDLSPGRALTVEEMRTAVRDRARKKYGTETDGTV